MEVRRRRAAQEELEEGERQMRKADERMKKEAGERGEKPIEDGRAEVRRGPGKDHEVQSGIEGAGGKEEPRSSNVPAKDSSSQVESIDLPPTTPPPKPPEEFASAGAVTPASQAIQKSAPPHSQAKGAFSASKKSVVSANGGMEGHYTKESNAALSPPGDAEVRADSEPLFTQEQLQQFQRLHEQASWLYPQQPQAMAYMTPQRLSFLLEGLLCKEEKEKEPTIRVFTDASFSPEGEESHGCFVVMLNDCLLFWRSGRQSTITLCIVEAVAVIISELCEVVHKEVWTDSQSAAAILVNEGGSWRTRHLNMRSGYAR